ncbi:hypothetical protein EDD85DRAFT_1004814 [Armillaria nabsnona]|nr:hypothetical protein EDD85DRAFT_1004814 [Armillaria nabsnona]
MAVTHTKLSVSFEDLSTIFPEEELFVAPVFGYGYHPVALGQYLKPSPYRVVRKLGHAAAGTVWLSEERRGSRTSFAVVKILSTYYTKQISSGECHESTVLQTIRKYRDHPGYPYVLRLRRVFNTQIAKRIVKQTLLALQLLHERGYKTRQGYTDIHQNHPPETYEPLNLPGLTSKPIITVKSQPLPDIGLLPDLSNLNIKLIDYGEGMHAEFMPTCRQSLTDSRQAFELVGAYHLFRQDGDFNEAHCRCGPRYFDRDGELKNVVDWDDCSIDRAVQGVSEVRNLDLSGLDEFLRACVIWDPRKRPTAAQLLAHPWLKRD